ncbi:MULTISPECIES: KGGVGR-motif variant AAA ATPase [unclassified Micromonospora]|uniref:KGGVGR-motif variant AAA ATPase n=1 Tax=unclassified Micromonospora TaxID=2617518 RepID=UPI003A8C6D28
MNDDQDAVRIAHPDHLFTWIDVNRYFARLARQGQWPAWLREVDAYWDSVRFFIDQSTQPETVWTWLRDVLGPLTIEPERGCVLLDDAGEERPLPVTLITGTDVPPLDRRPRWSERRVVAELAEQLPPPTSPLPAEMPVIAFHSFKGGVGRTLHCVAATQRLTAAGLRVLLVDADLEAPGITWMVGDSIRVDFAYEDFLALVHGAAGSEFTEAVTIGRKFLVNQELDGVIVMPARRDHNRLSPPDIEPVHLLTDDRDPYVLANSLAQLGAALGVDAVLVDLRAGASELSAPLLLDPRVARVFATTISDQSVRGTDQVLRELARLAPAREDDPLCSLLITQFSDQDHDERLAEVATDLLRTARTISLRADQPSAQINVMVDADIAIPLMTSRFSPGLLNLPASWADVADRIGQARLTECLAPLIESLQQRLPEDSTTGRPATAPANLDELRTGLGRAAGNLVYAETSLTDDFLVTDSLRNLAAAHRTELPIAIVIGRKGAGKTFTFLQLCRRPTWAQFAQAAGVDDVPLPAPTIPVLASSNLDHPAPLINERRDEEARRLTGGEAANSLQIRTMITDAWAKEMKPTEWRRIWLTCFARSLGLDATPESAEEKLTEFARQQSAIFVVDGLEDVFPNFADDWRQQLGLRTLLVDCADWLRALRGRPLGMVAFVRRDLVQKAIHQNVGQFEKRYEKYELHWNREEALRLAAWVCQRADALSSSDDEVRTASADELSNLMLAVWGDKMGTPKSKEARSEVWFFAALSDFQGDIQARDIVFFLAQSAKSSVGAERWSDRILTPNAMRDSLPLCSEEKIAAISNENKPVGDILSHLNQLDADQKKLPITLSSAQLSVDQVRLLEANGVIFREDDHYWIPEIFRHGLGFGFASGRRPRVLAVAKLARRRNTRG